MGIIPEMANRAEQRAKSDLDNIWHHVAKESGSIKRKSFGFCTAVKSSQARAS
jgi:hypothetical protein